jgi:hypothetical protein
VTASANSGESWMLTTVSPEPNPEPEPNPMAVSAVSAVPT